MVGITADGLALARRWRTEPMLAELSTHDPLLVTDLTRASILDITDVRERLEAAATQAGAE